MILFNIFFFPHGHVNQSIWVIYKLICGKERFFKCLHEVVFVDFTAGIL